jgi:hypothetical protein
MRPDAADGLASSVHREVDARGMPAVTVVIRIRAR